MIRLFGNLVSFSTLRYERKHFVLKRWAKVMFNYRNPAFSLAIRHQYYYGVKFNAEEYANIVFDNSQPMELNNINFELVLQADKPFGTFPILSGEQPFKLGKGETNPFVFYNKNVLKIQF